MDTLEAIEIIEGDNQASSDKIIEAWQSLIDSGIVWSLQGWYQRTATWMIEDGTCILKNQQQQQELQPCEACECTPCDCGWGNY